MAQDSFTRCPSGPLTKAFQRNVQQDVYDRVYLTQTQPVLSAPAGLGAGADTGVFAAGQGGSFAAQRVVLFPYAECEPGQSFWTRLYGWRSVQAERLPPVWLFYVLAEFLCVTGSIPGPVTSPTGAPGPAGFGLPVSRTENLCQSLALTYGVLGATGFVNSMPPGFNVTAFAAVELQGSQLISFDFCNATPDVSSAVAANCLWAMA